jgi:hypothetical protein
MLSSGVCIIRGIVGSCLTHREVAGTKGDTGEVLGSCISRLDDTRH